MCLLQQGLGARRAGAGGAPVTIAANTSRKSRVVMNLKSSACRSKHCFKKLHLEPGDSACCSKGWAPGGQGQAGAPASIAENPSRKS